MKLLALLLNLTLWTSWVSSQCYAPKLRKEIRELSDTEYNRYIKAALLLNKRDNGTMYSKWENFAKLHNEGAQLDRVIHGTPAFLPWHRKFVKEYELALQAIDSSVNLPYWDWTLDAEQPELSPVLTPLYMGGNGNHTMDKILDNGPFNYTQLYYENDHLLRRDYDQGDKISPFANLDDINSILANKKYSTFEDQLEQVHGYPHINVGNWEDFGMLTSPNDPLFYLHHAFVDLIWAKWQDNNKNTKQYEGEEQGMDVLDTDTLYGYNSTVASTIKYRTGEYCYKYPAYPRKLTPKRTTATNSNLQKRDLLSDLTAKPTLQNLIQNLNYDQKINKLTDLTNRFKPLLDLVKPEKVYKLKPLPDRWIKSNNFNTVKVRNLEAKMNQLRELVARLNPIADKLF